jgi:Vitamin K-dependent gamma-carboxylase
VSRRRQARLADTARPENLDLRQSVYDRTTHAWEHYWFGPVAAIRPYLLVKGALCLLAFDVWMLRVLHGGRYGDGGFNVAHFRWLDALQPLPSPGLYVGLMLAVGMLAMVCVFIDTGPWALALLALMWTYGWAMSMLDSYQHHYLLSLFLTMLVFLPRLRVHDVYPTGAVPGARKGRKSRPSSDAEPRVSSWAYVLLGVNIAIVYAFTAVTKLDPEWRAGQAFLGEPGLKSVVAWFARLGVSREMFSATVAPTMAALECLIAVSYVLAVHVDTNPKTWLRIVAGLGFLLAAGFHVWVELFLPLRIEWFSYYMILLACIYFLPRSLLRAGGAVLTWPVRLGVRWTFASATVARSSPSHIVLTVIALTTVVVLLVAVGSSLDLPGADTVGWLIAAVLVGGAVLALVRGRQQDAMRYLLATGLAGGIMWAAIGHSTVRVQYYTLVGDHLQTRGDLAAALEAYQRAARYAPAQERERLEQLVSGLKRRLGQPTGG